VHNEGHVRELSALGLALSEILYLKRSNAATFTPILLMATSTETALIAAITGATTGALAGAFVGWIIAPTRAEREERGRRRIDGRRQIADAIKQLHYAVSEARHQLYRLESMDRSDLEEAAVSFANVARNGSLPLPPYERWRVRRSVQRIIGKQLWRLAELRPASDYRRHGDSAALASIADTRTGMVDPPFEVALRPEDPISQRWDKLLDMLSAFQRRYP
jgi:hypothetical protein